MPGPWTQAQTSDTGQRPGLYMNFQSEATALITGGLTGIVAIGGIALWGPDEVVQEIVNETEIENYYTKVETAVDLPFAISQALKGGAASVLAFRMEGVGAAKGTSILLDTIGGSLITLSGKYNGARANSFTVTVTTNAQNAVRKDITLEEGSTVLKVWTTTIDNGVSGMTDALVAQINADTTNYYVTAARVTVGNETLVNVADQVFASGNDGAAILAADYTVMMDALEVEQFSVFCTDVQDAGILTSIKTWVTDDMRGTGKKIMWVTGAALADVVASAQADAEGYNHEGIIYVYPGFKYDDFADAAQTAKGSAAAARIAGIIASRDLDKSVTFFELTDVNDVEIRLGNADIKELLASGVLVLVYDGNKFKIERGINTLTTLSSTQNSQFKKIQVMRILDGIENSMTISAADNIVGKFLNNDAGQRAMLTLMRDFLNGLAQRGIIDDDFTVEIDDQYESTGDQLYVVIGVRPIDSIEYIFVTVTVQV